MICCVQKREKKRRAQTRVNDNASGSSHSEIIFYFLFFFLLTAIIITQILTVLMTNTNDNQFEIAAICKHIWSSELFWSIQMCKFQSNINQHTANLYLYTLQNCYLNWGLKFCLMVVFPRIHIRAYFSLVISSV